MLGICVITVPSLLFAARGETVAWKWLILVFLAALVTAAAIGAYLYFALNAPRLLMSEDYQLRHESLEIVREKSGKVTLDVSGIERIATSRENLIERGDAQ